MSKKTKIANTTDGVSSIKLDSIKKPDQQAVVVSAIQSISHETNSTIYLFMSTEVLTKKRTQPRPSENDPARKQ